jgi:DNA-binding protein HU-beta
MVKQDLVDGVAEKANLIKSDADRAVDAFLDTVQEMVMKEEKVTLDGVGTLHPKTREAHTARNPQTGESVEVPERKSVRFKISQTLKRMLNS